jgi:hypothetical protein
VYIYTCTSPAEVTLIFFTCKFRNIENNQKLDVEGDVLCMYSVTMNLVPVLNIDSGKMYNTLNAMESVSDLLLA